jgi:signal transduction histidine kinase/CheY-like chemotaxis protein
MPLGFGRLMRRYSFRFQLSSAAIVLVLATVATMLVPVYLSGQRAMLRAHREALTSLADALSSQLSIEVLDSASAHPGRLSVAAVTAHRTIRQHLPTRESSAFVEAAEYVMIRPSSFRLVIRSSDSLQAAVDEPWTPPAGLVDSIANIRAGTRSIFHFRLDETEVVVAPVYRFGTIPAALAVTRGNSSVHARTLIGDFVQLLWMPGVALAIAVGLALYGAGRFSQRITRLADQARSASDGELPTFENGEPHGEHTEDEVSVLRDALARMASGLRAHMQKAEQTARMEAVGRLSASIAHDFNNVLTVIQGNADIAMLDVPQGVARAELEDIRKAADRGAALTRQLLMFSGQRKSEVRLVAADDVLRSLEPMLRRLLGPGLELGVITESGGAVVAVDPMRLEQAVLNLVINARDAMPNGGTVLIVSRRATTEQGADSVHGPHVAITVSDTGHGIDAALQERIFEPFFTTKEPGKGTGLGLATVAAVVNEFDGVIRVHSVVGQGSTFTILLPETLGVRTAEHPAPAMRTTPRRESGTVLLVEDESAVRAMAARVLRTCGYRVIEVRHGLDALIAMEQRDGPIDLVLSDVLMPGMRGDELARRIQTSYPDIPIVLMSGYPGTHAGLGDVLLKPFNSEELLARVRSALKSEDALVRAGDISVSTASK